jgi:hypothetical protein
MKQQKGVNNSEVLPAVEMNDELRPEYDSRQLLKGGVRGKYAARYRAGTNLVSRSGMVETPRL